MPKFDELVPAGLEETIYAPHVGDLCKMIDKIIRILNALDKAHADGFAFESTRMQCLVRQLDTNRKSYAKMGGRMNFVDFDEMRVSPP